MSGFFLGILAVLGLAHPDMATYQGYGEGEYVLVAPQIAGTIETLDTERGQTVHKGDVLFTLEHVSEQAAVNQAKAEVEHNVATLADLLKAKRKPELDQLVASRDEASAALQIAEVNLQRDMKQIKTQAISQATLDTDRATLTIRHARNWLKPRRHWKPANCRPAAMMPCWRHKPMPWHRRLRLRKRNGSSIKRNCKRHLMRSFSIRFTAWVSIINAGQPIVSLLPSTNIKVRFFVPATALPALPAGTKVQISETGAKDSIPAHISYISPQAEYSPPELYNRGNREKLFVHAGSHARHDARKNSSGPAGRCRGRYVDGQAIRRPMSDAVSSDTENKFAISVHDLRKSFGTKEVVRGCSIDVPYGSIYGFLGPNGTGKTTTIRMLCGLLTPDGGEGTCLGFNIRTQAAEIKRRSGYMPQKFGLYDDLTIRENLEFVARLYEMPSPVQTAAETLHRLGLEHRHNQLAGQLSGGWKQRLALASCVLHKPHLLLLDEPTAGVDPKARREFWDEIHAFAASGITILVSTHYMDEAERCHQIGYLLDGRLLVHGQVADVIASAHLATWRISSSNPNAIMLALKDKPGVEMLTSFGAQLHVAGGDVEALRTTMEDLKLHHDVEVESIPPTLEDIFIHTMSQAKTNGLNGGAP